MMKTFRLFSMAALALMMAACSSEDNTLETASPAMPGKLQFTATVEAPGTGATTRTTYTEVTSGDDAGKIKVAWNVNDEIAAVVTNSEGKYVKDVLTVSKVNTNGSATISGDITKPKDGEETVDLIYPADIVTVAADGSDYSISFEKMRDGSTLDGKLETIAANIDYRMADDCELTVSGDKATLTSAAKLESKLSIWKLTLKKEDNSSLSATQVSIADGAGVMASATLASAASEVYLPVPDVSGADICIAATTSGGNYIYMKEGVTLEAKKYYQSTVQMTKGAHLALLTDDIYEAKDGETLTGTLASNVKISIANGATVTLKNVNITNLGDNCDWAGINCPGDATLVLEGTNEVCAGRDRSGDSNYPGIYIAPDMTLTIQGDGSLTAYSNVTQPYGAGIGGGYEIPCGNIVINSGTITATGGQYGAAFGGGYQGSSGNIVINSGTITATGGQYAAGIGGGGASGTCGNITISGGTITATGGQFGAAIGGSVSTSCGNIAISGGTVKATGGQFAAGIGGGTKEDNKESPTWGTITFSGGTVEATGGQYGAAIGGGRLNGTGGAITITSGVTSVKATGGTYAQSIGAGYEGSTTISVTIGGTEYATGISQSPYTYPEP